MAPQFWRSLEKIFKSHLLRVLLQWWAVRSQEWLEFFRVFEHPNHHLNMVTEGPWYHLWKCHKWTSTTFSGSQFDPIMVTKGESISISEYIWNKSIFLTRRSSPVDSRPSDKQVQHFVQRKKRGKKEIGTQYMWYVTHNACHMKCDMWHMIGGGRWTFFQYVISPVVTA